MKTKSEITYAGECACGYEKHISVVPATPIARLEAYTKGFKIINCNNCGKQIKSINAVEINLQRRG